MTQADIQYAKLREQTLNFEDALFNKLLAGVPDCYAPLNDYSVWGTMQRALAQELTRIQYADAYDLVSLNPQYLNPADIQRQFAAVLFINKSFPTSAQSDQTYRQMLLALIAAYMEGATIQSISDVITAYTGQTVNVEELYKQIGQGVYDATYRNTIQVSLNTGVVDPFSQLASIAEIQTVAEDLYTALDLAKPAHVGLDYSITFGTGENLGDVIEGWTDAVAFELNEVEMPPLPPVFTFDPLLNPTSPNTQFSAIGPLAGSYFTGTINGAAYAALMSDAFRAEYASNGDGTYTLIPACANDVLLEDANGNLTGAVSKAVGVLAPQENLMSWLFPGGDAVEIVELD
jgi:hypothetical protein